MTLDCLLCGTSGPQVRPRMVEWRNPVGTERWSVIPLCSRDAECVSRPPATTRDDPPLPVDTRLGKVSEGNGQVGNGTVSEGQGTARADAPRAVHEPTEFQQRVPRPVKAAS